MRIGTSRLITYLMQAIILRQAQAEPGVSATESATFKGIGRHPTYLRLLM